MKWVSPLIWSPDYKLKKTKFLKIIPIIIVGLGIDLHATGVGLFDGVTQNDDGDVDTGSNLLLNFPVIENAVINGVDLILSGFAPAGAEIELFIADNGPNPNPNPFSVDFGEGETYLVTLVEGSNSDPIDTDNGIGSYNNDSGIETSVNKFSFSISIPSGVTVGTRLTSTATFGNNTSEFSAIVAAMSPPLDFGDAPNSYLTLDGSGGAKHSISNTIRIGPEIDGDNDGFGDGIEDQTDASDDDLEGIDDEDGVNNFEALTEGTTTYDVDVIVTNNTGNPASLIGWIDFDGDGIFQDDEGTSAIVNDGTTSFTSTLQWLDIGSGGPDIEAGTTFVRIRLTTDTTITESTPGGLASDGEVEDYQITISGACSVNILSQGDGEIAPGGNLIYDHSVTNTGSLTGFVRIDLATLSPILSYNFIANGNVWNRVGPDGDADTSDDIPLLNDDVAPLNSIFVELASGASANFRIQVEAPISISAGIIDNVEIRVLLDEDGDYDGSTADQCEDDVTDITTVIPGSCVISIAPPLSSQLASGGTTTYRHSITNNGNFTGFVRLDLIVANPSLNYIFVSEGTTWQQIGTNGDAELGDVFLNNGETAPLGTIFTQLSPDSTTNFSVQIQAPNSVPTGTIENVQLRAVLDGDGDFDGTTTDQCEESVNDITTVIDGFLDLDKDASVADTHEFNSKDGTCSEGQDGVVGGPCDEITYTLTYKNLGVQDAIDLTITDQIPDNTAFVNDSAVFNNNCDGTNGDLPDPGAFVSFDSGSNNVIWTLTVPVSPGQQGCLEYKVTIDSE